MPRNIEIKARLDSVQQMAPRVASLATEGPVEDLRGRYVFLLPRRSAEAAAVCERHRRADLLPPTR